MFASKVPRHSSFVIDFVWNVTLKQRCKLFTNMKWKQTITVGHKERRETCLFVSSPSTISTLFCIELWLAYWISLPMKIYSSKHLIEYFIKYYVKWVRDTLCILNRSSKRTSPTFWLFKKNTDTLKAYFGVRKANLQKLFLNVEFVRIQWSLLHGYVIWILFKNYVLIIDR